MEYRNLLTSFGMLNRIFMNYTTKALEDEKITYTDSIFLTNIGLNEGITQEEIAVELVINKSAITRSVKLMQELNLVKITKSEEDRREKKLYLTDEGKYLFNKIVDQNNEYTNTLLNEISYEEIKFFEHVLKKISFEARKFAQNRIYE